MSQQQQRTPSRSPPAKPVAKTPPDTKSKPGPTPASGNAPPQASTGKKSPIAAKVDTSKSTRPAVPVADGRSSPSGPLPSKTVISETSSDVDLAPKESPKESPKPKIGAKFSQMRAKVGKSPSPSTTETTASSKSKTGFLPSSSDLDPNEGKGKTSQPIKVELPKTDSNIRSCGADQSAKETPPRTGSGNTNPTNPEPVITENIQKPPISTIEEQQLADTLSLGKMSSASYQSHEQRQADNHDTTSILSHNYCIDVESVNEKAKCEGTVLELTDNDSTRRENLPPETAPSVRPKEFATTPQKPGATPSLLPSTPQTATPPSLPPSAPPPQASAPPPPPPTQASVPPSSTPPTQATTELAAAKEITQPAVQVAPKLQPQFREVPTSTPEEKIPPVNTLDSKVVSAKQEPTPKILETISKPIPQTEDILAFAKPQPVLGGKVPPQVVVATAIPQKITSQLIPEIAEPISQMQPEAPKSQSSSEKDEPKPQVPSEVALPKLQMPPEVPIPKFQIPTEVVTQKPEVPRDEVIPKTEVPRDEVTPKTEVSPDIAMPKPRTSSEVALPKLSTQKDEPKVQSQDVVSSSLPQEITTTPLQRVESKTRTTEATAVFQKPLPKLLAQETTMRTPLFSQESLQIIPPIALPRTPTQELLPRIPVQEIWPKLPLYDLPPQLPLRRDFLPQEPPAVSPRIGFGSKSRLELSSAQEEHQKTLPTTIPSRIISSSNLHPIREISRNDCKQRSHEDFLQNQWDVSFAGRPIPPPRKPDNILVDEPVPIDESTDLTTYFTTSRESCCSSLDQELEPLGSSTETLVTEDFVSEIEVRPAPKKQSVKKTKSGKKLRLSDLPRKLSNILSVLAPKKKASKLKEKEVPIELSDDDSFSVVENYSSISINDENVDSEENVDTEEDFPAQSESFAPNAQVGDMVSSAEVRNVTTIPMLQQKILSNIADLPTTRKDIPNALVTSLALPLQTALTIVSVGVHEEAPTKNQGTSTTMDSEKSEPMSATSDQQEVSSNNTVKSENQPSTTTTFRTTTE